MMQMGEEAFDASLAACGILKVHEPRVRGTCEDGRARTSTEKHMLHPSLNLV